MATLTAWKFPGPTGADDALATLERLQKEELIVLQDAAVVTWPAVTSKRPKTRQLQQPGRRRRTRRAASGACCSG